MSELSIQPAELRPQRLPLVRLLLLAMLLPAAIAAVNYALIGRASLSHRINTEVVAHFTWYVAQVGIVGYAVGRGISQPVLRWLVFGWILLLINFLGAALAMDSGTGWRPEQSLPPAALFAGEMGLCVVWAVFGDTRWTLRWPAMIVLTAGLYFLWLSFGNAWGQRIWTELLLLQVATLLVLSSLLRLTGFRLLIVTEDQEELTIDGQRRPLQFGIKHVLIWTTALAILLGMARGMDLLRWEAAQQLVRSGLLWKLTVATASAIVILVALWVALGKGHWLLRFVVGLLLALLVGIGLAIWSRHNFVNLNNLINTRLFTGLWSQGYWELLRWYEIGYWWIGWIFLSSGLLAATLIILRTLGYRLVRIRGLRRAPR